MVGKTIISHRSDPHAVYDRILPDILGDEYYVLRRSHQRYTSKFRIIRIFILLIDDILILIKAAFLRNQRIFVAEFSSLGAIFLFWPLVILKGRYAVELNVNHNLNNKVSRLLNKNILCHFFKLAFIEPPNMLLTDCDYLTPIYINRIICRSIQKKWDCLYVFLGARCEQWSGREVFIRSNACKITLLGLDVKIVGGQFGEQLNDDDYIKIFENRSLIVIDYSIDSYEYRHSGIALEAICNEVPIFMQKSSISSHYVERGFAVFEYNSGIQLVDKLINFIRRQ